MHLRDQRRSVYTLQWRHERDDERAWVGTEQVVGRHWVARAEVSPLVFRDSTTIVWDAGADVYYGSYGFAGATVVRDPRDDGLWVVPVRVRLANERNDWVQVTRRAREPAHARLGGRREVALAAAGRRAQQPVRLHDARQHDLHRSASKRRCAPRR